MLYHCNTWDAPHPVLGRGAQYKTLNIKEWVNEWVRLPSGSQKNYGQPVLYQPVVINISSFPVTPTALDLLWKTFINHILEIPYSSQAKLSHVRGLQKSPSCLSNMVSCLTLFTCHCSFLWIGNSLLFLAKKKKGKAGSAPTRQRRKGEEKGGGNSDRAFHRTPPSPRPWGSWLRARVVVLTLNL